MSARKFSYYLKWKTCISDNQVQVLYLNYFVITLFEGLVALVHREKIGNQSIADTFLGFPCEVRTSDKMTQFFTVGMNPSATCTISLTSHELMN
jgi:hypothetical protein